MYLFHYNGTFENLLSNFSIRPSFILSIKMMKTIIIFLFKSLNYSEKCLLFLNNWQGQQTSMLPTVLTKDTVTKGFVKRFTVVFFY